MICPFIKSYAEEHGKHNKYCHFENLGTNIICGFYEGFE